MRGKHEAPAKTPKMSFANVVITVCVVVALLVTAAVVWEYHRLMTVMPSGVITALFAFWGGELLVIALRQVFGSDVLKREGVPTSSGPLVGATFPTSGEGIEKGKPSVSSSRNPLDLASPQSGNAQAQGSLLLSPAGQGPPGTPEEKSNLDEIFGGKI